MRTTLEIDDDVLNAAKRIARRMRTTAGAVISDLARRALAEPASSSALRASKAKASYGFAALPARGVVVTDDLINRIREVVSD